MEEKIKNIALILLAVIIALLAHSFYQNFTKSDIGGSDILQEVVTKEEGSAQKTTSYIPASPEKPPSVTEDGVYLVYYFNEGFSPNVLQIRQGSSVRFVNKSNHAMRVFTSNTDEHKFNQLNQAYSVGKGGTYDFTFIDKGVWTYFNYDNKSHNASILVY